MIVSFAIRSILSPKCSGVNPLKLLWPKSDQIDHIDVIHGKIQLVESFIDVIYAKICFLAYCLQSFHCCLNPFLVKFFNAFVFRYFYNVPEGY